MANNDYRHYKIFEAANQILKHQAEVGIPTNAYLKSLANRYGITTQEAICASKWLESKQAGNDAFPDDSANFPCNTHRPDPIASRNGYMLFDEVGSDSKIDWTALAYMIANGVGKPRMRSGASKHRPDHSGDKSFPCRSGSLISKLICRFDASIFPAHEVNQ